MHDWRKTKIICCLFVLNEYLLFTQTYELRYLTFHFFICQAKPLLYFFCFYICSIHLHVHVYLLTCSYSFRLTFKNCEYPGLYIIATMHRACACSYKCPYLNNSVLKINSFVIFILLNYSYSINLWVSLYFQTCQCMLPHASHAM